MALQFNKLQKMSKNNIKALILALLLKMNIFIEGRSNLNNIVLSHYCIFFILNFMK